MKKLKLVLVGNGMAGVRTLEELLKIAPDLYDITTVFGAWYFRLLREGDAHGRSIAELRDQLMFGEPVSGDAA